MAKKQLNQNNDQRGSNRRKPSTKETTFYYRGKAIWYPLNPKEKEEALALYPDAEINNQITKLCDSGYGVSVKPQEDEGIKISLLGYEGENEGLMLTVLCGTLFFGLRSLLYRHFNTFNEIWRTYESEE